MTRLLATASLIALAGTAQAGNMETPIVEPIVVAPAPMLGGDWTGGYAGLSFGNLSVDGTGAADGNDLTYGVHVGYDYDFGTFVMGGELEFDATDVNLGGAATVNSVARAKVKAGYDAGPALIYLTAGAAQADTSLGNGTGYFGGVGMNYMVTDSFYVGAEVLQHRFENIGGTPIDADATSVSIRGGIRF